MEIKTKSKEIGEIAQKYGLELVVLFGSRARGDNRSASDADVAYLASVPLPLMDEARLALELAPILGGVIDLANIKGASPLLARHIFKDGKTLYEREAGLSTEMFIKSLRVYQETVPLYEAKFALL